MSHLTSLDQRTDEERAAIIAKAQAKRKEKREQAIEAAKALKTDWADENLWKELSSKLNVRMFRWFEPATSKMIGRALKKVNRDKEWFKENFGYPTYKHHEKENPRMTANAFLGFCLEAVAEEAGILTTE